MKRTLRSSVALVIAPACAVALMAGCGSDNDAPASSGGAGREQATLRVAYPGFAPTSMLTYIAQDQGFFERENLTVEISDGQGANVTTLLVSGRADFAQAGPDTPLNLSEQGKQTSIVYGLGGGGLAGFMVGSPKTAGDLEQLRSLDACRMATFAEGTPSNGYARVYSEQLGLHCDIVPFADVPSAVAALAGGRADAVVASYGTLATAIGEGKAKILIDTRDPDVRARYIQEPFLEAVEFGVEANLRRKRDAVVRYVKALGRARAWAEEHSDAEIADLLAGFGGGFAQTDRSLLTDQVAALRQYMPIGNDDGGISEEQWRAALAGMSERGVLPGSPEDEAVSYERNVDMSFYDEAVGAPDGGA